VSYHERLEATLLGVAYGGWQNTALDFALDRAQLTPAQFQDPSQGGFQFTAQDHEELIHRPKPMIEEALTAGNGVAARVLGRPGHFVGETRDLDAAAGPIRAG
jgi:uncharacterized protein YyaL (SSP411 family)